MAAAKGRTEEGRKLAPRRGRLGLGSRLNSLSSLQSPKVSGKKVGSRKSQGLPKVPAGPALRFPSAAQFPSLQQAGSWTGALAFPQTSEKLSSPSRLLARSKGMVPVLGLSLQAFW